MKQRKNEKIKIIFISPPLSAKAGSEYTNIKIPLGLIYMAGVLEENGFEVKIIDCPVYYKLKKRVNDKVVKIGLYPEHVKKIVEDFNPDIIGVSCAFTMHEGDSFEMIEMIKKNFPNKLVVVGGAHSSISPAHVLRNKNIDIVVIGEGEETMLEIAKRHREGKKMDNVIGTALRVEGKIKINKPREFVQNLDALKPAWHLIDFNLYFSHPQNSNATMRRNAIDIVTSRGCPGNCVFCAIKSVCGRKWRARTPKNVVDELEFLYRKHGARQFRFQDDNLTLDKKRIIEICDEIVKRGLDIRWDTPNGVALWSLDKEILAKMKKAGCYRVTFGIESACKKTQGYVGKVIDLSYIREMVDYCHKIGLWVCATFIIGFPDETLKEIRETENFIVSSKINFPFVYIAQPFPGTRMYDDFKSASLLKGLEEMSHIGETRYNTLHLRSDELNQLLNEIYKKFYFKKAVSYMNPFMFYSEFLKKIKSYEDLKYVMRMVKEVFLI